MRQVLRAGALGRPRGIGWGGRWEWCSGWGTHVNPWLIHVNVWQKPLQWCKVISLQLIKINGEKKAYQYVLITETNTHKQVKYRTKLCMSSLVAMSGDFICAIFSGAEIDK